MMNTMVRQLGLGSDKTGVGKLYWNQINDPDQFYGTWELGRWE